jgi:endonuclease/exonuclease/phosphatase family metal-dependent hydrolase
VRLRVVSWNVRYFGHGLKGLASTRAGLRDAAEALASLRPLPHVIALQEVEHRSLRSRLVVGPGESQLEAFMEELERAFAGRARSHPFGALYFPAHVQRLRGIALQSMGLAVLVDEGALRVEAHNARQPQGITHFHVEALRARKQLRIAAHLELHLPDGRRFHVFNTHLSLPTPFHRNFWLRRERLGHGVNQLHEAKALAAFVRSRSRGEPFLVAGDFNASPASPVYRYLTREAGFTGAQEALGQIDPDDPRGFPTAGFFRMRMHLDHLFAGGGLRPVDLEGTARFGDLSSPFAGRSDHVPLIGRFDLK